ncbi:SusC/RagA family TonB-linked outer membrane protein [Cytophagaceae bacterium YF14B1]|uniref:SusC/RagA family TonB-linked outer membrane protein n=1 Tax=Xanthocytophaga flava TaxID=3048013 RepID=A0AAE3U491_9BACT|nr:SusC/RagA family TonB-linked outer membrane protein [Xanthocytophaga flavus]MDJ1479534.1 SusC/RagA family TonB-linked outer membrane protein [Xanthocytophaga flavus]
MMNLFTHFTRILFGVAGLCLCLTETIAQEMVSAHVVSMRTATQTTYRSLKSVLDELKSSKGIYYMFNSVYLKDKPVTVEYNKKDRIEAILSKVLTPSGLTFRKVGDIYVIIDEKEQKIDKVVQRQITKSAFVSSEQLEADIKRISGRMEMTPLVHVVAFTITGRVTSETDEPLPGVNVVLKETTVGAMTDNDGKFSLAIPDDQTNGTLVFSSIGYIREEVPINNRAVINLSLVPDLKTLNEVVVIGYGTQRKEEVTSAVASVKAAEFRQSGARNALDLVQGKVAGLTVTRSGTNPNSGVSLQIRGVNSLRGDQQPLVVIDGIPGGNLDLLQQDDIESIDVLKDGSAAAIYGTRANGGVILVTTKRGKAGPAQFDYSTYFRKEYVRNRPDFLNASEYRQKIAEGLRETDYGYSTDFYDLLINHSNLTQNHNLAMSGGSKNTTYRASIYYLDLQGVSKANGRTQYGGRVSLNQTGLNDRLTAQFNLATNFNRANLLGGGGWESSLTKNPTLSVYNPDGTYYFEQTSTNEVARLAQETSHRQQQTTSIDGKLSLDIIRGLRASIFGALQRDNMLDGEYRTLDSEFSLENDIYKGGGYASRYAYQSNSYTLEPTISYNRTINNFHSISAVGGYSYQYFVEENFWGDNYGFVNDIFEENNLGTGNQLSLGKAGLGSGKGDNKLIAFFGRVNYSYEDKYMLSLILRREGSSRFGANNKWGNFPAVSAGWNISKENFMKNISFLNSLKIRAGYGVTGNQGIPNYSSLVTLSGGGLYVFPDGQWRQTYGPDRNPNPNLRWEKKKELNLGIDFAVLNSRVSGSIDIYERRIEDLLDDYTSQLPPFIRENIFTNVGTISNKGIELALSATPIKNGDFSWVIDATASTGSNKMVSFSNEVFKAQFREYGSIGGYGALGNAVRTFEGGALGNFYGKRFAGFDENGKWLFYNRNGEKVPFSEINTGSNLETTDLAVIGNAIPKYYASLTNTLTYKNLSLRFFFRGRFKYDILNTMDISYGNQISKTNLLKNAFGKHAQINDTYQYSDYYLEKGGFVKLDEVTLSYTFKLKTPYIRNLRLYVTGSNLAVFTKYTGNDPDYVSDTGLGPGIDGRDMYPNTRSFLIGLNAGF